MSTLNPEELGRFARHLLRDLGKAAKSAARSALKDGVPRLMSEAADTLQERFDADKVLRKTMAALIETAAARYPIDAGNTWSPGKPLELLLVGYSGTRNTGADVRVEEMIRQFRHLLGDEALRLSILTLDPVKTRGYFPGVRQIHAPTIFPKFLFDVVHQHHGAIACEGSMFKSKFANALTTFMVGALGVACAEQKLAIGYGGEAGAMDPDVEAFVRTYCEHALVIARNKSSVRVLEDLGIRASLGADTAWTFEPHPPQVARDLLAKAGWDGRAPVVVCCPINPFWWPVTGDWRRGAEQALFKTHGKDHYKSIYFHASSDEIEQKQNEYLDALYAALRHAKDRHGAFVALVGMEALDRKAAESLAKRFPEGEKPPLFISDEHEHKTLVSVLRQASVLVSSRYHAIVTSMPAGIPAVGVTMDERIRNLMGDAHLPELSLEVGADDLAPSLIAAVDRLITEPLPVREKLQRDVARQLHLMGTMGQTFIEAIRARHPALPIREGLGEGGDPIAHLPPLSTELLQLLSRYGGVSGEATR